MPNRKTFDDREKYDHSGRPLEHRLSNDLHPDVSEEAEPKSRLPPARRSAQPRPSRSGRSKNGPH
jgi:hypothetical protein